VSDGGRAFQELEEFHEEQALWWAVPIGTVLALVTVRAALAQKANVKGFKG
jgi:hypothetical protein